MDFTLIHPREQIVLLLDRVYRYGMTTTSGGNLSILDDEGNVWISPAGIDKGRLRAEDVICVRPTGESIGPHRPSSEYPFHRAIYNTRPDIRAILHAHPAALVAFSIVRKAPDTRIIPQAVDVCGAVGYAPYALPGSQALGENIAQSFAEGFDCVLLENHGVVCGGPSLLATFHRFETLDFCARLLIRAATLGKYRVLDDRQLELTPLRQHKLEEFTPLERTNAEKELRRAIVDIVHRAYDHQLMTSTEGTVSVRLDDDSFLITPTALDRKYLDVTQIVLVERGAREAGKAPSRSVRLHQAIYARHPEISAIVSAQAPNSTAFAVTDRPLDTRTIPESYIMLRDIPKFPFGSQYVDVDKLAAVVSPACPVVLLENDAILTTGRNLLEAYDRLEVADFTARSLIHALPLGDLVEMNPQQVQELQRKFLGG